MIPVYETEEDRQFERDFIDSLGGIFPLDITQAEPLKHYDFKATLNGRCVFLMDLKRANRPSTKEQYVLASKEKYTHALETIKRYGLPTFLIIRFEDCTKLFNLWQPDIKDATFTRKDRNETRPVVKFLISKGKVL